MSHPLGSLESSGFLGPQGLGSVGIVARGDGIVKIRFGWLADGAAWSARPNFSCGAGEVVAGPRALVSILATRLGLTHPPVQHSTRVAQYRALMAQHLHEWFAASFELDPWNTAAHVLALRDEAVAAGWSGGAHEPDRQNTPRLHALWFIEQRVVLGFEGQQGANLCPGPADDLAEILGALEARTHGTEGAWPLGVTDIACADDPTTLPGQWPLLFKLLEASGVRVTLAPNGGGSGVQKDAAAAVNEPVSGPAPSFLLVRAPHATAAAEVTARLIAEQCGSGAPFTVLATADTIALDAQLTRRGLPPVAHVPVSHERLAAQVIPLFLDTLTPHFDVHALAALLSLEIPTSKGGTTHLLPSWASRELLNAVAAEAGISDEPDSAWQRALEAVRAHDLADGDSLRTPQWPDVERFCQLLAPAARNYYAAPLLGAPENSRVLISAVLERLDFLDARLAVLSRSAREIAPVIRAHSRSLRALLVLAAEGSSDGALAEREIADLVRASAPAQASLLGRRTPTPWTLVTDAAHVVPGAGTVIWWGATDDSGNGPSTWDRAEADTLRHCGATPWTRDQVAALDTHARLRALAGAERVIAVAPERELGEQTRLDPIIGHLAVRAWRAEHPREEKTATLTSILKAPRYSTTAHALMDAWREAGELAAVDEQVPQAPTHLARRVRPGTHLMPWKMSYTQLHMLITDSLGWVLRYPFGIKAGGAASVPTGAAMTGTLVHALIEELVREHTDSVGHVSTRRILEAVDRGRVGELMTALVPRYTSELALPGNEALLHNVADTARDSIRTLFSVLLDTGIAVRDIEHAIHDVPLPLVIDTAHGPQALDVRLGGSIDFLGEDASDTPVVLDFKWTRGERSYRDRVRSGTALQLATYAWALAASEGAEQTRSGYFLLRQGQFVSNDPALGGRVTPENLPGEQEIFASALAAANHALASIASGEVRGETPQNAVMGRHPQVDITPKDVVALRQRSHHRRGRYFEETTPEYSDYTLLTGVEGDFS